MTLLEAFKQTKKKWEWIIENSPDCWASPITCGFCEYVDELGAEFFDCFTCPIEKVAGRGGCRDTPFRMEQNLENALLEYDFLHYVALSEGIIE